MNGKSGKAVIEPLLGRIEALEGQNRFWRAMVGLLVMGGLLLLPLREGVPQSTLEQRVTALETKVAALENKTAHFSRSGNNVFITGANLHIRSGQGATNGYPQDPVSMDPAVTRTNGLGNLIVGYNELRGGGND